MHQGQWYEHVIVLTQSQAILTIVIVVADCISKPGANTRVRIFANHLSGLGSRIRILCCIPRLDHTSHTTSDVTNADIVYDMCVSVRYIYTQFIIIRYPSDVVCMIKRISTASCRHGDDDDNDSEVPHLHIQQ